MEESANINHEEQALTPEQLLEKNLQDADKAISEKITLLSKQYKTTVTAITFKEVKDGKHTGRILAAYAQEPNILTKAKIMDMIVAGRFYEAGHTLYPIVILDETDSEVKSNEEYKLSVMGKLGGLIELQLSEIKKN